MHFFASLSRNFSKKLTTHELISKDGKLEPAVFNIAETGNGASYKGYLIAEMFYRGTVVLQDFTESNMWF